MGYSEDFVKGAEKILGELKKDPVFTVAEKDDQLCENCPHARGGCDFKEKVLRYDALAVKALGVSPGESFNFDSLGKETAKQMIQNICADCEWYGICSVTE